MTELEIRGVRPGLLLDEPLLLSATGEELLWRARYRDDDSRVWRARAERAEDLLAALGPAKPSSGPIAALQSLRPVQIDVRVEAPDGRAAGRAVTRRVVADGVRLRRWRDDGLAAVLHLPAGGGMPDAPAPAAGAAGGAPNAPARRPPRATLLVDATGGPHEAIVAALAGPLLASRGVLVLSVAAGSVEAARERLGDVPGAGGEPLLVAALDPLAAAATSSGASAPGVADGHHSVAAPGTLVLPPGIGTRGEPEGAPDRRAAAWDALLTELGAVSRAARAEAQPG